MAFITLLMMPVMIFIGFYVNSKTYKIQNDVNEIREDAF
jgi:hypothetical protein